MNRPCKNTAAYFLAAIGMMVFSISAQPSFGRQIVESDGLAVIGSIVDGRLNNVLLDTWKECKWIKNTTGDTSLGTCRVVNSNDHTANLKNKTCEECQKKCDSGGIKIECPKKTN